MWLLFAWATDVIWISQHGDSVGYDFYPRWYGAREMLQGNNPYSLEINRVILADMGFPEFIPYKHNFSYLATITFTLLPFWALPFFTSLTLWSGLQLLMILALPALTFIVLLDWRIKPPLLALLIFFSSLVYRQTMISYVLGQFIVFCFGFILIAYWQILRGKPWLVALALIAATTRPEGVIFASAILFDLLLQRRFRPIIIFAALMGGLFLLSVIWIGWWIPDFLEAADGYRDCCDYTEPTQVIGVDILARILWVAVIGWAGWMFWQMRALPDRERIAWSLSVLFIAYLLIFTQSKGYTLIYALFPIWVIVWADKGRFWTVVFAVIVLSSPWLYFGLESTFENSTQVEQLATPLILLVALTIYWRRYSAHYEPEITSSQAA